MHGYLTLTRRELAGFFLSLRGYVIVAAVALLTGLGFVLALMEQQGKATTMPMTELFSPAFFWLILLPVVPAVTMRLFAMEKFSGTFETLMTAPVSDVQVVAENTARRW